MSADSIAQQKQRWLESNDYGKECFVDELLALNADLLAALEAHVKHIAVHDRACCRELEAQGNAAIDKAERLTS